MQLLTRRTFLELAAATGALAAAGPGWAAARGADVFTADAAGGLVDSTILVGDDTAMLVDAQFTVPNATAVADMIAATGKRLETVFITHFQPDHILGLDVILRRFPDARPVTHAAIQPLIAQTVAGMLANMSGGAPAGVFAERAIVPDALTSDHIMFEGSRIDVLDPMHGDTDMISALHAPDIDTLIVADFAYADTHAWTAENTTPERAAQWLGSLRVRFKMV